MEFRETTENLLRPNQVEENARALEQIEGTLNAPPWIANQIQNKDQLLRQRRHIKKLLETSTPTAYAPADVDRATKRADALREEIRTGMPTQEEMRRAPAGAVDKHRRWEMRNKKRILEWRNIQLRLHASDRTPDRLSDPTDLCNIERFRPSGGAQQLNMQGEQIPGKAIHIPDGATRAENIGNVMSDEDRTKEEAELLALAERLAAQGSEIGKRTLARLKSAKKSVQWTPEKRAAMAERMKAVRAKKQQAQSQPSGQAQGQEA